MTNPSAAERHREANVELDLRIRGPLSEEALDAHSDEVMDAVERFAADIALGPALAINAHEMAIKLQFDVIAATTAELHQRLSTLLAIVERETALPIDSLTTTAEFSEAESAPG